MDPDVSSWTESRWPLVFCPVATPPGEAATEQTDQGGWGGGSAQAWAALPLAQALSPGGKASDSSHQARSGVGLWPRGLGRALRCCLPSLTGEMGAPSGPVCAQGAGGCIRPNSVCVFQGLRRRLCGQQAARSRSGAVTLPWASPAPAHEPSSAPVSSAGRSSPPGSCAPTGPR